MDEETKLPDLTGALRELLQDIEPRQQPLLLAALERLAADRYRIWAKLHEDAAVCAGLNACADREDEIATRIESLYPDAKRVQAELLLARPEIGRLNLTLFEGRPLNDQFSMQAQGERAGAAAWIGYAEFVDDAAGRDALLSCSELEEANAEFLEGLLG